MSKMSAEYEAARDQVAAAIRNFAAVCHREHENEGDDPIVVAWVAGYEWTSVHLEANDEAGRFAFGSLDQTISSSLGLGKFIARQYR